MRRILLSSIEGAAVTAVKIDGVLVQPMAVGGRELILGGRQDEQFGPVVLLGMGGIFVEIFEEVSVRVVPISRREATAMVEELRGAPILMGARGQKRFDVEAVVEAILRLGQLLQDFPEQGIDFVDIKNRCLNGRECPINVGQQLGNFLELF